MNNNHLETYLVGDLGRWITNHQQELEKLGLQFNSNGSLKDTDNNKKCFSEILSNKENELFFTDFKKLFYKNASNKVKLL